MLIQETWGLRAMALVKYSRSACARRSIGRTLTGFYVHFIQMKKDSTARAQGSMCISPWVKVIEAAARAGIKCCPARV